MTGALVKASKATAVRYERHRPGELANIDVKRLSRIPDGGGWRDSTAPCKPSGPTDRYSHRTMPAPKHLHRGSSSYNTQRRHSALKGQPPISRLRPTC